MSKTSLTEPQLLYTWHLKKMDKDVIRNLNNDTIAGKKLQGEAQGEVQVA